MESSTSTVEDRKFSDPVERNTIELPLPRKRGRPPGSKNGTGNNGASVPSFSSPPRPSASPSPDTLESAKFIGTGFVALVELAESFVHGNAAKRIEKKFPERLVEFRKMSEEMGLQEKEKELISASVEKIAVRHDWMTKFAPEVVLCIALGQYTLRQTALLRFVNNTTGETKNAPQNTAPISPAPSAG